MIVHSIPQIFQRSKKEEIPMKWKTWLKRFLICILLALLAYLPFRPVPIVRDPERAQLTSLNILDPATGDDKSIVSTLSDAEQKKLLEYLATCRERRLLIKQVHAFSTTEMPLRIQFDDFEWGSVTKMFGLGEQNRLVYLGPFTRWQHAVLEPEEVQAGILELLEQFEDADTVLPAPFG